MLGQIATYQGRFLLPLTNCWTKFLGAASSSRNLLDGICTLIRKLTLLNVLKKLAPRSLIAGRSCPTLSLNIVGSSDMEAGEYADACLGLENACPETMSPVPLGCPAPCATLDTPSDPLGHRLLAEQNQELNTAAGCSNDAPQHSHAHLSHLQSPQSPTWKSLLAEFCDDQDSPNDHGIVDDYKTLASLTSDDTQTAEVEKLISDSAIHAQRRDALMKAFPVPVFHYPKMEALSQDDLVEINFMAEIFFAAQAWEYAYRLYSLIFDSWNSISAGIPHSGRVRSAMKVAQAASTQSQCTSAIQLLEDILTGYELSKSDGAELYLIHSQLADVLRKSGDTEGAQRYMQSVSANIPFRPSGEHQSALLAPDLRVSCFLVQEHTSRMAIPHALDRFMTVVSPRQSRRLSFQGALRPLLTWCATVLEDQVLAQSMGVTRRPDFVAEPAVRYPVSDDRDCRSTQLMLLFCLLWKASEREHVETSERGCGFEVIEAATSVHGYTEMIRQQTYMSKPRIFSAIACMTIPLHSRASKGGPGQILSSELYEHAHTNIQELWRLTDLEVEDMFMKAHAESSTLDADAKKVLCTTDITPPSPNGFVRDFIRRHVSIKLSNYGFEKVAKALDIWATDAQGPEHYYYWRWLRSHNTCFLLSSPGASNLSGLGSMQSLADRIREITKPSAAEFEEVDLQPGSVPMQRSSLSQGLMRHRVYCTVLY
jgi:hypothetical protein